MFGLFFSLGFCLLSLKPKASQMPFLSKAAFRLSCCCFGLKLGRRFYIFVSLTVISSRCLLSINTTYKKRNILLIDLVCDISRWEEACWDYLCQSCAQSVPEAVTPLAYFVRRQNSSGTRAVEVLTRLRKLAETVRKIKQEGHQDHENKQNKKIFILKSLDGCSEPVLLKSVSWRDSGTFLPSKTLTRSGGPQVPKSVLLVQLWVQLEGGQ